MREGVKGFLILVAAGVAADLIARWLQSNVRAVRRATEGF